MYFINVEYGVAGDMIASAFIDLKIANTIDISAILENAANVLSKTTVSIKSNTIGTKLIIKTKPVSVTGLEMQLYLKDALATANLSKAAAKFASKTLDSIIFAEAKVHGESVEKLRLHETGSADTIVDLVCVAYFYDLLKLAGEKIYASPIAAGKGKVKTQHGVFDIPSPATALLLKGLKWFYGPYEGELATPTGVAILKNLITGQKEFSFKSAKKIGIGFGTRKFKEQKERTFVKIVVLSPQG